MDDSQFNVMQDLFSSTKFCEIAFHNFCQALPWLDLVSNSGSTLRQLSIYTEVDHWAWARSTNKSEAKSLLLSFKDSSYVQYLQLDEKPGFTYVKLLRLSSLCPNIEKLGFDIHGMELEEVVCHTGPRPPPLTPASPSITYL